MSKHLRALAVLFASISLLSQMAVPLLASAQGGEQDAPDCYQQPDVCQAMLDQYIELYGPLPKASPGQATMTATATSITPGTVLYPASDGDDFSTWDLRGPWQEFQGMLVSDGSSTGAATIPVELTTPNYAVEAEFQVVEFACNAGSHQPGVGFTARNGLLAAGLPDCGNALAMVAVGDDTEYNKDTDQIRDNDWHHFRLEVSGNQATLYVDGILAITVMDNQLIDSQSDRLSISAWNGWQVNVRNVTVTALGE